MTVITVRFLQARARTVFITKNADAASRPGQEERQGPGRSRVQTYMFITEQAWSFTKKVFAASGLGQENSKPRSEAEA